ncbi:MAG: DsbA family protein [Deltaproteobacteria bacterium]|nr:DsbA family protein [Deltaproteobacteria bacterium]
MRTLKTIALVAATAGLLVACGKSSEKSTGSSGPNKYGKGVKVELYAMAQCPFGVQAEQGMIPAVKKLAGHVDFHIDYIATPKGNGQFKSLHGPKEVQGDIAQLCARKLDANKYLDFIMCQNVNSRQVSTNWQSCAAKAGLDKAALQKCKDGPEGKKLLEESAARAAKRHARGSPTIFIAGKRYSGGRSMQDFMRGICNAIKGSKPAACSNIPAPAIVNITMLNDKRCKDRACRRAKGMLNSMKRLFPGAVIKQLDYSTKEGKDLYVKAHLKVLPAILFDKTVEKGGSGYNRIRRYLLPAGEYKSLRVGARFDPNAEICDNGKDDTGNGKVDCQDPTCVKQIVCRKEIPKRLDLFVMSHCPYGTRALNASKEVVDNFKGNIDFHIHYIGNKKPDGTLTSMHGLTEVQEDKRELCAIKYYPKNFKYMDYILCRNKNIRSKDWKSCADPKKGFDAAKIEKCFKGDEGKKLLADSIEESRSLGFGASPTWLANNKFKFSGVSAEAVRRNFCQHNKGTKGCDKKLSTGAPRGGRRVKRGSCGH